MKKYIQMKNESRKQGERNDCTVIATAIAFRLSYATAHRLMQKAGRRKGCGVWYEEKAVPVLQKAGLVVEELDEEKIRQPNGSRYTAKTIGKLCKRGYYVAICSGHAFAVVNGEVLDWTQGRRHIVNTVLKCTKPHGWEVKS